MLIWACDKYVYMEWSVFNISGDLINNKIKKSYNSDLSKCDIKVDFYNIFKKKLKKTSSNPKLKIKKVKWWENNFNINGIKLEFNICVLNKSLEESEFKFISEELCKTSNDNKKAFLFGLFNNNKQGDNIISLCEIVDYSTKICLINLIEYISDSIGMTVKHDIDLDCICI